MAEYWVKRNTTSLARLPGMRHERMGDKWAPSSIMSGGRKATVAGGEDEDEESWWGLGYIWTNVKLVAVGAGLGTAVASYVFKKRLQ